VAHHYVIYKYSILSHPAALHYGALTLRIAPTRNSRIMQPTLWAAGFLTLRLCVERDRSECLCVPNDPTWRDSHCTYDIRSAVPANDCFWRHRQGPCNMLLLSKKHGSCLAVCSANRLLPFSRILSKACSLRAKIYSEHKMLRVPQRYASTYYRNLSATS